MTWTPIGASVPRNSSGADADGTVGISPMVNAEFTMDAAGDFDVDVAYTATFDDDNDEGTPPRTEPRTSTLPPFSLQQLANELDALGDFDALPTDLIDFDPDTSALRVDLAKTFDPAGVEIPINVGNQLEAGTGVAGLQSDDAVVSASASGVGIDLTAGVFLLPPADWGTVTVDGGCPDPSVMGDCADALNLFFVEVDPAPGAHEFVVEDAVVRAGRYPLPPGLARVLGGRGRGRSLRSHEARRYGAGLLGRSRPGWRTRRRWSSCAERDLAA